MKWNLIRQHLHAILFYNRIDTIESLLVLLYWATRTKNRTSKQTRIAIDVHVHFLKKEKKFTIFLRWNKFKLATLHRQLKKTFSIEVLFFPFFYLHRETEKFNYFNTARDNKKKKLSIHGIGNYSLCSSIQQQFHSNVCTRPSNKTKWIFRMITVR